MKPIEIKDGIINYTLSLSDAVSMSTKIKDVICIGYIYILKQVLTQENFKE